METLKHSACTVGWVARLCCNWLSPGKATRNSYGRSPNGTIELKKKQTQTQQQQQQPHNIHNFMYSQLMKEIISFRKAKTPSTQVSLNDVLKNLSESICLPHQLNLHRATRHARNVMRRMEFASLLSTRRSRCM